MGLFEKLITVVIDKIVKTRYKDYFDAVHASPKFQESMRELKKAPAQIEEAGKAAVKAKASYTKTYNDYVEKYGKKAADKVIADTDAGKAKLTWRKPWF